MRTRYVPGLMSKLDFTVSPVLIEPRQCRIEQLHLEDFFSAGDEVSVFVKDGGGEREVVVAAPSVFAEANRIHIDAR